ncbi:MAG TPA: hypothetical protein VIT65_25015 [Microlunatus sp.]
MVTVLTSAGLLTVEVIAAHLAGEVFVGLYPLLSDNSCWFPGGRF